MATVTSLCCSGLLPRRFSASNIEIWGNQCKTSSIQYSSLLRSSNYKKSIRLIGRAVNFTEGHSDEPAKVSINKIACAISRLSENFPQPMKEFPWPKAIRNAYELLIELIVAVAKYLSIPVFAVSSLSEMSYCAHERKMIVIPIPFLIGFTVAGVLKDTAQELSQNEGESQMHLLLIAAFFLLLKLPGPYYPYWGRLIIPHFANGGLLRTIWSAITRYIFSRRTHATTEALSERSPF